MPVYCERRRVLCVSHSLVHEIKWNGWRAKKILFALSPKLHLLILDLCGGIDWCCLYCFSCAIPPSPGAFIEVFIEVHLAAYPQARQFILNRPLPQERAGGPFEACWLALLFCCLGRFFRGGVTQLCIVFYSLALLGVHPKFGSAESTK